MLKKVLIVIIAVLLAGSVAFTVAGVTITNKQQPEFADGGYVLDTEADGAQLVFNAGEKYRASGEKVSFTDGNGHHVKVPETTFLHMNNGSVAALSDGVLLDFNDLSSNFVNNYYISSGLSITPTGEGYTAESATGNVTFGDNLWKLSQNSYIVQSPAIKVTAGDGSTTAVEGYVEVETSDDGFVTVRTDEQSWTTLSESFCLETSSGVKVYPVSQIVDSGKFKMSITKLTVDPEDSIILTEDETRRQIVPELDITGVDGEDGTDGNAGSNGVSGANGSTGANGQDGVGGGNGSDGLTGADGAKGGKGSIGRSASVSSSTNTALPTMTIGDWVQTATSLRGSINVYQYDTIVEGNSDRAARITIFDLKTGESFDCLEANASYGTDGSTTQFTNLLEGTDGESKSYYFVAPADKLHPDGSYRLSVTAYYKNNDTFFQREFISRTFSSDSTGVTISPATSGVNSLDVRVRVQEDYRSTIDDSQVYVYLLTPEQNRSFSLSSKDTGYTQRVMLDYGGKQTIRTYRDTATGTADQGGDEGAPGYEQVISFSALNTDGTRQLPSDTEYVLRVRVQTGSADVNYDYITEQELTTRTLKQPISWDTKTKPTAYYNRATGSFDVYRQTLSDINGGIQEYSYIVYKNGEELMTRTVSNTAQNPISFPLPTGTQNSYTFKIKATFFDNEKNNIYDLGTSDAVMAEGDSLPRLTYTPTLDTNGNGYWNKIIGTININLEGEYTSMLVDEQHPMTLTVYADQLYQQEIQIKNDQGEPVSVQYLYDVSLSRPNANNAQIALTLENLYRNTNYTITVSAYLNLGENSGDDSTQATTYKNRVIGTVSDRTTKTQAMNVRYEKQETTEAFAQKVSISTVSEVSSTRDNTMNELKNSGTCRIELLSGSGINMQLVSTRELGSAEMEELCNASEGLLVNEQFFNASLQAGTDYTIRLTNLCDGTAAEEVQSAINYKYVNTFDELRGNTMVVKANQTPPELITDPSKGITVTPILNKNSSTYGKPIDNSLPADATVGFLAEAKYNNGKRLGQTITYYVMEYTDFYTALVKNKVDPILGGTKKLMTMTLPIDANSDTVPKVVVFFGGTANIDGDGTTNNYAAKYDSMDTYVYYAGSAENSGSGLSRGMDRGYRYVFAYTAIYSSSGELTDHDGDRSYPYSRGDYETFAGRYGAGTQYDTANMGKEAKVYVLNSGPVEAPRMDPEFHTYISSIVHTGATKSEGTATIAYKYRYREDAGTSIEMTFSDITDGAGNPKPLGNANEWNTVDIPFSINGQEPTMVEPKIKTDRYLLLYTCVQSLLNKQNTDKYNEPFYLCHYPIECDWEYNIPSGRVMVKHEQHLDQNYIAFYLDSSVTGDNTSYNDLYSRAYALKLKVWEKNNQSNSVEDIYLPLQWDTDLGPMAKLDTSRISKLVGKTYQYQASVLYDNGKCGWKLVEPDDDGNESLFALQYVSSPSQSGTSYGFSDYLASSSNNVGSSSSPAAAVAKLSKAGSLNTDKLEDTVKNMDEPKKCGINLSYLAYGKVMSRNLYVDHFGVDIDVSSYITALSGRYIVPKGCSEYELLAEKDYDSFSSITPAIQFNRYETNTQAINFPETNAITVTAKEQAIAEGGDYKVYVSVFANQNSADTLSGAIGTQAFTLGKADGKGQSKNTNAVSIGGLRSETTYWIAFWMKFRNGSQTENRILQDVNTAQKAIYEFKTIKGVSAKSTFNVQYRSYSYFEKECTLDYSASPFAGFVARYSIRDSEGVEIMSHDELTAEETGILEGGSILSASNSIRLNLEPSVRRSRLLPGQTYTFHIGFYSELPDGIGDEESGSYDGSFTISQDNPGVHIYANETTGDSVSFQVTMRDAQYSFMGRKDQSGNGAEITNGNITVKEGGLYAVRFTYKGNDGVERRLHTTYDSQIFCESVTQQQFVLSDAVITQQGKNMNPKEEIKPMTDYTMYVYAVLDANHDGYADGDGSKTWEDFFIRAGSGDENAALASCGTGKFLTLVESFWNSDGTRSLVSDTGFQAGSKLKQTTDKNGIFINKSAVRVRRSLKRVRMELAESAGIILNQTETFPRVAWSIDGTNMNAEPVYYYGNVFADGSVLLPFSASLDPSKYPIYLFEFPQDLEDGTYTLTISLYMTTSTDPSVQPYETISMTLAD